MSQNLFEQQALRTSHGRRPPGTSGGGSRAPGTSSGMRGTTAMGGRPVTGGLESYLQKAENDNISRI